MSVEDVKAPSSRPSSFPTILSLCYRFARNSTLSEPIRFYFTVMVEGIVSKDWLSVPSNNPLSNKSAWPIVLPCA